MVPAWFFYLCLLVFGLIFGSFGNVVIWRLPRGESLSFPPSHCPNCETAIAWYDNLPVLSWVALRARCRSCGNRISARYPAVELLSAGLWLAAGWRFGQTPATAAAVIFFYALLLLSFIDWDTMRLPDVLTIPLAGVGLALALVSQFTAFKFAPLTSGSGVLAQPLVAAIGGSVAAAGLALIIALVYRAIRKAQGFGMGDVKLLAAMGPFLGWYAVVALFVGSVLGAAYGITAMAAKRLSLRTRFPFGPFLAAAAVIVALFGPQMWQWYTGLFRL